MFASLDLLIALPALYTVTVKLFLTLDLFRGQFTRRQLKVSDKSEVDVHLHNAVTVDSFVLGSLLSMPLDTAMKRTPSFLNTSSV